MFPLFPAYEERKQRKRKQARFFPMGRKLLGLVSCFLVSEPYTRGNKETGNSRVGKEEGVSQSRIVSAEEARVTTAAVELKVVCVGRKQMTLSVFRQLEEEQVIDPTTGDLRGLVWGRVNYYFDGCERRPHGLHLHILWQKGAELRRCCVEPDTGHSSEAGDFVFEWQQTRAAAGDALLLLFALFSPPPSDYLRREPYPGPWRVEGWSFWPQGHTGFDLVRLLWDLLSPQWAPSPRFLEQEVAGARRAISERLRARLGQLGLAADVPADLTATRELVARADGALRAARGQLERINKQWPLRFDELRAAEQLFIAI